MNITTNYNINGIDLSNILQPYSQITTSTTNTQLYVLETNLANYFLPPQGTASIYSASWEANSSYYLLNNTDILSSF